MTPLAANSKLVSLTDVPGGAESKFDQDSFVFDHGLAGHPLFTVPKLLELAKSVARRPGDLYFDVGDVKVDQKWGQIPLTEMTYVQVLNRIETAGAWMIMKHVEEDPAYGEVLRQCADRVLESATPKIRALLRNPEMLIIVSSPNRITPFHMDGECNFLLQVQGHKTVRVFNRNDRSILTEEEIERFYTIDGFAATFKPGIDEKARQVELTPGKGVHIPVLFPHWVRNGSEVSVSVSINFEFPDDYRADLYRANHFVRNAGIAPHPPGKSQFMDSLKLGVYRIAGNLRKKPEPAR